MLDVKALNLWFDAKRFFSFEFLKMLKRLAKVKVWKVNETAKVEFSKNQVMLDKKTQIYARALK